MSDALPHGWAEKELGDVLVQIIDFRGRTPKKLDMDWGGGDIPALSANNVQMGKIDFSKECYFGSDALYDRWMSKGETTKDDIVFTMEAPLGNVALVPDDRKYILSQRVILLKTDRHKVHNKFLYQQLRGESFQRQLKENSTGSTALGIQQKRLVQLPAVFPPLPEQQKIASILNAVDDVIESTQAQINKLKDLKTGMMQELLTKGIGHTEFKDSPVGRIPKAWNIAPLGAVFPKIVVGYVGNVNDYYCRREDGVPFYRTQNIRSGLFTSENIKYVTHEFNNKNRKSQIFNDDILVARVGANLGMTCKVTGLNEIANIANAIIIKSAEGADSDFYTAYLCSDVIQGKISSEAAGGAQGVFNTSLAQELIAPVPPLNEQKEIAKCLSAFNCKLISVCARLDHFSSLKKALMQDLLTGKVRVKVN